MAEQNVTQALGGANSIYLMEDGEIVFEGHKEDALSNEHVKEVFLGM